MILRPLEHLPKQRRRLKSHLGRLIGALIASTTAFMIAGLNIGTLFIWILPSIFRNRLYSLLDQKVKIRKGGHLDVPRLFSGTKI